jgi:MFS family permease
MQRYERLPFRLGIAALLLIAGTYVVNAMDRIVFATLLPAVSQDYGFPLAAGGFLATVFTLGLGVAGIPTGFLFDRMSRKTVAVLGIVIYSVCTLLTCLSIGFADMAAYRAVSGIGEAMQNAAIFTACGAYFSRNRSLALGALNVAYGIGSFIGPRWGASLLTHAGTWRYPLYVYGGIGLAGAILLQLLVSKRFTEQVLEREERAGEAHIPEKLINRNTVLVALASIGGGLAGFGYLGLYPTFLRTSLHFSLQEAGAAASMYGAGALMGIVCGFLGDRINQKWLTIVTLAALAVVGYAIFNLATTPFWQQVLSFLEGTASSGFLYVNNYSLMQRSVRSTMAGRASGLVVSCVYLPAALSGYLFAELKGQYDWGGAALLQMSLQLVVPIIAMMFFDLSRTSCPVRHGRGISLAEGEFPA